MNTILYWIMIVLDAAVECKILDRHNDELGSHWLAVLGLWLTVHLVWHLLFNLVYCDSSFDNSMISIFIFCNFWHLVELRGASLVDEAGAVVVYATL